MGTVVTLITILVGLVSGLTAGLATQSTSAIDELPADHIVFDAPAEGESPSFTVSAVEEPTWREWNDVPGVADATPVAVATSRAQVDGRTGSVAAFGVPVGAPVAPESGALDDGSVVLSTGAAEDLEATVGDRIEIAGRSLEVAEVSGDASFSHTPVVWTTLDAHPMAVGAGGDAAAGSATEPAREATFIALSAGADGELTDESIAAADDRLGTETLTREDSLQAIASFSSENGSLQLMRGFLFVISALVIGAFFSVWTIQRTGDIAVLKALGASTRYLLRDALGQAAVLLALGTAVGSAIAVGVGAAIGDVVPFTLDAATVAFPAIVLIALGMVGAALSVRRVVSVDPLTALGGNR